MILIGKSKVGKTSIINQYLYGTFNENIVWNNKQPEKYIKDISINNRNFNLEIYDIPISTKLISYYKHFLKSADIIIMVYDCTNKQSFKEYLSPPS